MLVVTAMEMIEVCLMQEGISPSLSDRRLSILDVVNRGMDAYIRYMHNVNSNNVPPLIIANLIVL